MTKAKNKTKKVFDYSRRREFFSLNLEFKIRPNWAKFAPFFNPKIEFDKFGRAKMTVENY
jgi:hypothetical protein